MLNIVLRTVCGCERIITIPFKSYPRNYRVPYIRGKSWHAFPADGESMLTNSLTTTRTFEHTGLNGIYGYRVYLEVLENTNG